MERYNSNKRYQVIIAGILMVLVIFIIISSTSGFFGKIFFYNKDNPELHSVPPYVKGNYRKDFLTDPPDIPLGSDNVSVDQEIHDTGYTVEPGTIELVADNIPDELPICISPCWAADKWVAFKVLGGYEFKAGMLTISQYDKTVWNPCINGMYVGYGLELIENYRLCDGVCSGCYEIWNFTFNTDCDNWICLDSSYDPDGGHYQEHKDVTFTYDTTWTGCDFDYILAHERHVPRIPNSRCNFINYFVS
jgi:hypothetical protein